jgi:hypothetical protein
MEGDGHNPVGIVQQLRAGLDHERRQRTRQPPPSIVFECMDDRSQRPFIVPGCARGIDRARSTTTAGTLLEGGADDAP